MYRNSVWFFKGLREYTRGGYQRASRNFNQSELDVDISGKSFMVTGANSGIGKATALDLAKKGGTVHIVCRNRDRGEQARRELIELTGNQNIHLHILDISRPRDVISFAEDFIRSNEALDVLVNNAGALITTRELTEDGLERNFATNTLGTYLLTSCLMPVLEQSESPRVVTVSSGGMLLVKLDARDLQSESGRSFDGSLIYAQNKRQQVVMTRRWSESFPNIHFSSMHPGWADTPGVQSALPQFYRFMQGRLRSSAEGADTVVWLSVAKRVTKINSGSFFQDRQPVAEHLPLAWTHSTDEEEQLLMTRLEEMRTRFTRPSSPIGD